MVHLRLELNLGRLEGIVGRELELQLEDAAIIHRFRLKESNDIREIWRKVNREEREMNGLQTAGSASVA